MKENILISACLLGNNVRYDGGHCLATHPLLERWKAEHRLVSVCPEILAGLSVPRTPCEIVGKGGGQSVLDGIARVLNKEGKDFTEEFTAGAKKTLDVARMHRTKIALLKNGSPSCGSTRIYDGSFTGMKIAQKGVTAALL